MRGVSPEGVAVLPPTMNPEVARIRRHSAQRKRKKCLRYVRLLWLVAGFLLCVLAIEVLIARYCSPRFWVTQLDVRGVETLTMPEVVRLANIPEHTNSYRLSLARVARRIHQGDPRVGQVNVHLGPVGTVVIDVRERQAVCRLGTTQPPSYLDAGGVLFTRPVPPAPPVPVVEGITPPTAKKAFGRPLASTRARTVLACLAAVRSSAGKAEPLHVTRIIVAKNGSIKLLLREGATVLLGRPHDFPAKLWVARQTIAKASSEGYPLEKIVYIDVRVISKPTDIGAVYLPKHDATAPEVSRP